MEFSAGWQLLQAVVQNVASHVAQNLGRFTDAASDSTHCRQKIRSRLPLAAVAAQPQLARRQAPGMVTKADVGRATWLLLHTIAAQFPENPTRQQRRDVSNLVSREGHGDGPACGSQPIECPPGEERRARWLQVDILTRLYPCAECAKHFKEVVRWVWPLGTLLASGCGRCLRAAAAAL